MNNLTLHIGRHKSGTSTIQSVLAENEKLLKSNGYYYPLSGRKGNGHHHLSEPLARGRLKKNNYLTVWSEPNRKLQSELKGINCHTVISSEAFQNCDPSVIRSAFGDFDTRVVVYLREQCSYLLSAYSQKVQATDFSGSIEEFYENSFSVNYSRFLNQWSIQFGEKLDVRVFDRAQLYKQDVVLDFLIQVMGIDDDEIASLYSAKDSNPSISPRVLAFKLLINRTIQIPDSLRRSLYKLLATMSSDDGSGEVALPEPLIEKVTNDHRASNSIVCDEYSDRNYLFNPFTKKPGELYVLSIQEAIQMAEEACQALPESEQFFKEFCSKIR